jgi:hypothetical protein
MGGGSYSFDRARELRSPGGIAATTAFDYQGYANDAAAASGRREVHPLLNVYGQARECQNAQAIVVALDVTRSRGDDSKIVYEKLPLLIGWLEMQGYLPGAAISLAAIGDASSDQAPLQISQWERDNRLDEALGKFWLEGGGGGTGEESYELAAYFYAHHTQLKVNAQGHKGYFFFVGDEGFYPKVAKHQVKAVLGQEIPADLPSDAVFRKLQEKFHVFFVYPQKSWQDRRADIDAEIAQRVKSAGGQYDDVDIRISLLWNTRDDLDLHVVTPAGEEIYYGNKRSRCGGCLDIDRNVHGEDPKPVENTRWARGTAPTGRYRVFVQNYRYHEQQHNPITFRVEMDINGVIRQYSGVISAKHETGAASDHEVASFEFAPTARPALQGDAYSRYDDATIQKQWAGVLPAAHILLLDDPAGIIDVMVGAIGLTEGKVRLDTYLAALDLPGQTETTSISTRRQRVARALGGLSTGAAPAAPTAFDKLPPGTPPNDPPRTTRRW